MKVERCWEGYNFLTLFGGHRSHGRSVGVQRMAICSWFNQLVSTEWIRMNWWKLVGPVFHSDFKKRREEVHVTLSKESCETAWKGRFWKHSSRILLKLLILIESPTFFSLGPNIFRSFLKTIRETGPKMKWQHFSMTSTSTKNTNQKGDWLNTFCNIQVTHR